jgi:hypothetical protein
VTDPITAELALAEAEAAQRRTRATVRALALPLVMLGVANLAGVPVVLAVGRDHLLAFFGPAYVVIVAVSARHFRRVGRASGTWLPVRPWVAVLVPTAIAGATLSRLGFALDLPVLAFAGPAVVFALATAVTARWLRSTTLGVASLLMLVATAGIAVATSGDAAVAIDLAVYGVLLVCASKGTPREPSDP